MKSEIIHSLRWSVPSALLFGTVLLSPGLRAVETPVTRQVTEVRAHSIAGGKGSAAIFFDGPTGSPESAMTLLSLGTGAQVPEHVHEKSVEFLYVLEGEAEMMVAGKPYRVGPGTAVRIPMNTRHSVRVVGARGLRAIQVYTPAGPEQRFIPKGG